MSAITNGGAIILPAGILPWASRKGQVPTYAEMARQALVQNRTGRVLEFLYIPWGTVTSSLIWSIGLAVCVSIALSYYPGIISLSSESTKNIPGAVGVIWMVCVLFIPLILERIAGGYPNWEYYGMTKFRIAYPVPSVLEKKIAEVRVNYPEAEFRIGVLRKGRGEFGHILCLETIDRNQTPAEARLNAVLVLNSKGEVVPSPR